MTHENVFTFRGLYTLFHFVACTEQTFYKTLLLSMKVDFKDRTSEARSVVIL